MQQIQASDEDPNTIEHMKLSIAPDAALILSQGDTLILETHGKNSVLTQRLLAVQKELRDKYKDVQNSNTTDMSMLEKNHNLDPENQYSPKEKVFADKKFPVALLRSSSNSSVKLEDLVAKVLKRVNDLVSKPIDLSSNEELTKRVLDIGVSWQFHLRRLELSGFVVERFLFFNRLSCPKIFLFLARLSTICFSSSSM